MAGEDPERLKWVKTLRCLARGPGTGPLCLGPIEAHHAGRRGMARRAHDNTAVPLCTGHHRDWHDGAGAFKGWTKDQCRAWTEAAVAATQAAWNVRGQMPDWA
jgi:hypothetical protein